MMTSAAHASKNVGARNGRAKLTEDDVAEIRSLLRTGAATRVELATRHGVCYSTISSIAHGDRWSAEIADDQLEPQEKRGYERDRLGLGFARRWTRDEEQRLAELAGTMPPEQIGEVLGREFGFARTRHSVKVRASRLGLSVWPKTWSMQEVSRLFRVDSRAIERQWIRPGLLRATHWRTPRPGDARWSFQSADVEAFIRSCPWAYDWRRMDRRQPMGKLAEIVNRADPWLTWAETAPQLGEVPASKYWLKRGMVPHRRRLSGGRDGRIVVRAKGLPAIIADIEAARQHPGHKRSGPNRPRGDNNTRAIGGFVVYKSSRTEIRPTPPAAVEATENLPRSEYLALSAAR